MQREKLVDIWFVFRTLKFVANYGDFTCVTCILYVAMVEILHLQLRYVWLRKLHALATERLYHATFLSNSTFLFCLHMLLLSELSEHKSAELWVL